MLETRKVDNNRIHKALFVNLRPEIYNRYALGLLRKIFWKYRCVVCTLYLKKVPTFKLSVTLSNLSRCSKCLHCWKVYEICYIQHYPPHPTHVATLPWDIKNSNFLQLFNRCGKMQTNFIFSTPIFTARTYARAVLGVVILSVRPSVRLSVCHTRAL